MILNFRHFIVKKKINLTRGVNMEAFFIIILGSIWVGALFGLKDFSFDAKNHIKKSGFLTWLFCIVFCFVVSIGGAINILIRLY